MHIEYLVAQDGAVNAAAGGFQREFIRIAGVEFDTAAAGFDFDFARRDYGIQRCIAAGGADFKVFAADIIGNNVSAGIGYVNFACGIYVGKLYVSTGIGKGDAIGGVYALDIHVAA